MPTNNRIDLDNIQSIILRGYAELLGARFCLLEITEPTAARAWLGHVYKDLAVGIRRPRASAVNLALSYTGLGALELDESILRQFPYTFAAGMTNEHSSRVLGDIDLGGDANAPVHWRWGGNPKRCVHMVLCLYARTDRAVRKLHSDYRKGNAATGLPGFENSGLRQLNVLTTHPLVDEADGGFREHFGFRDGIGQPRIRTQEPVVNPTGLLKPASEANLIEPGEVLIGYPNEDNEYAPDPSVHPDLDPQGHLPYARGGQGDKAFGRNGSYLVMRQLQQYVDRFWLDVHRNADGTSRPDVYFAAKIVGRWPSGNPLSKYPNVDRTGPERPGFPVADDDFGFQETGDGSGHGCPLGAHIRRANPRDGLEEDPIRSLDSVRRHRIVRRGRPYGKPVDGFPDPAKMLSYLDSRRPSGERGLHFLCLNADIAGQFEFIQQMWMNNRFFAGLPREVDPLTGCHPLAVPEFTIQTDEPSLSPLRQLHRYVRVRGGGYFFVPGRQALRYLAARPVRCVP